MRLPLDEIVIDPDIQLRNHLDAATIARYVEMLAHSEPPPVTVWGAANFLSDGAHRVAADKQRRRDTIEADWREGTKADAIAHAAIANVRHGLPLPPKERGTCATHLLKLGWTLKATGEALGMTKQAMSNLGLSLQLKGELKPTSRHGKGGTSKRLEPLPEDVRDLPNSTLGRLYNAPDERRVEIARYVKDEGLTERETVAVVKAVNAEPDIDQSGIHRIVKDVIKQLEDADAWSALRRYKVAVHDLQRFTVEDVVAALPPEEHPGWLSDLDDMLRFLHGIRDGLGSRGPKVVS